MLEDDNRIYGPSQLRVFRTQLVLSLAIGISTFLLFCVLRRRWPHMYAVRTLRKNLILQKLLPNDLFKWVGAVLAITDEEVLEYSGLDAFVVLAFFKMGILTFLLLSLAGVLILSPIRYYFTGNYDKDNIAWLVVLSFSSGGKPPLDEEFPRYLWVYPVFTYFFSGIVYWSLFTYTSLVIRTRQKYLASQNSITDRTIKVDGIPKRLIRKNDPLLLKRFIEDLGIGRVVDVKLIYDWLPLQELFDERSLLILKLEKLYSRYYGLKIDLYNKHKLPRVLPKANPDNPPETPAKARIHLRIDALAGDLTKLDRKIRTVQKKFDLSLSTIPTGKDSEFKLLPSAFITMDSVASAQMAAQTVLDPRVYKLMVSLAPAAKDINWKNLKLSYYEKLSKSYMITFFIVLSYSVIFFLVTTLSTLLDIKTITKVWPALGHLIAQNKWLSTFVTGILPPLLFSLMNVLFPYLYKYLTLMQGYALSSEIELSTLLKNFFFIFFILFLVFTITGTLWDYFTSIGDTTKFASQLASSLKKLSLFYVDLILLQGLAMFPVKLLQIGDFVILNVIGKLFLLKNIFLKTPRDYRFFYYTPPVFDFGINLPQHILIFIIILIYLVVSTKIVTSGLVYFILGYFVYKYQLIYSFVHPPHSTGKVWPMIFRRLIFGLIIFQLFMCGTLALEGAILLSVLCTPLFVVTLIVAWNFEKYYLPLHNFIALRAIQNPFDYDKEFNDDLLLVTSPIAGNDSVNASGESLLLHVKSRPILEERQEDNNNEISSDTEERNDVPTESSILLDGDFSTVYHGGINRHRRKVSTVDEEREQFTDYTYPNLVDPLFGPWIGFEGDFITMVEYREDSNEREVNAAELENGDTSVISHSHNGEFILRKRIQVPEWE
ncbi:CIC11C00000001913 [Sungouiella intermedia]|uniref:CIC11C00000001913 n=1 Tax=Sungouiella intermedia TaxID=45354 RepID=A0A1L0D4J5_9ASCO|nr:CIC11C00000001913 [[Candida] intermedia]